MRIIRYIDNIEEGREREGREREGRAERGEGEGRGERGRGEGRGERREEMICINILIHYIEPGTEAKKER